MPNLAWWSAFEFAGNDGGSMDAGSLDIPTFVVPSSGAPFRKTIEALAQNSIAKLYDATTDISDFTFCYVLSDTGTKAAPVMLELVTDNANVVKTTPYTVPLLAGVPFVLFGSTSYANYTVNFGGGTLSVINLLRVKNLNSAAANISIWMLN